MKIFKIHCILILCLSTVSSNCVAVADSSVFRSVKFNAVGSVSVLNSRNRSIDDLTVLLIYAESDFFKSKQSGRLSHLLFSHFELSMSVYIDSITEKDTDLFTIKYVIKSDTSSVNQTLTTQYETGFLNGYKNEINPSGITQRVKTDKIFCPSKLDIGYGFGYEFGKNSLLNISLTSARFSVKPKSTFIDYDGFKRLTSIGKSDLYFDYGFSCQLHVSEKISSLLGLNVTGNLFIKTFRRDELELDLSGNLELNFSKLLQLRINSRLFYSPVQSSNWQIRNELFLGVYFTREK